LVFTRFISLNMKVEFQPAEIRGTHALKIVSERVDDVERERG
jgi:hypothetical protein